MPRFESGSYSERAAALFTGQQGWEAPAKPEADPTQRLARTVTWAYWPHRYWLEQSAEKTSSLFSKPSLRHRMFHVALMSAARKQDGRHELERWYIVQPRVGSEKLFHIQQVVDTPEAEAISGEMKRNFDFTLNNGLYIPNEEDLAKLDAILERGRMDGVNPITFAKR